MKAKIGGMIVPAIFLGGCWWILTNGSVESWLIGLPALAIAAWARIQLSGISDTRISLGGLAGFLPYFIWESLRGGTDVARRTMAPRMRIQPGFSRYRTGLKNPAARALFTNCVGLLPGTLAADLKDDWLEIHALDVGSDPNAELARLEAAVARIFSGTGDGS